MDESDGRSAQDLEPSKLNIIGGGGEGKKKREIDWDGSIRGLWSTFIYIYISFLYFVFLLLCFLGLSLYS